jgi:bifunctional non-homologous end joining protein LigD
MARAIDLGRLFVPPMKALLVENIPAGDWRLEIKYDGFRAIATVAGGAVELWSRNRNPLTQRFPEVADELHRMDFDRVVLDGEIVALDTEDRTSFQLLQNRDQNGTAARIAYFVFDLLAVGDRVLLGEPLHVRQKALAKLLRRRSRIVQLSPVFDVAPKKFFAVAQKQGWEGIIAKARDSIYEPDSRSGAWLKCKIRHEQEFVIGGFPAPRGARLHFGALLVGYHAGGKLRYAGKVGAGFSGARLAELRKKFSRLETPRSPFADPPRLRDVAWVRPKLVCQVSFAEWTSDGRLRQPSFLGLRDDKSPSEVVREKPAG